MATYNAPSTTNASPAPLDLESFLRMAVAQNVSDIHLRVGSPPLLRRDGDIVPTKLLPVDEATMLKFAQDIAPAHIGDKVQHLLDYDFGFELKESARFRVNFFHESNHLGLVLRVIPKKIPSIEDLGLPPILKNLTALNKGLVLVTGPTGAGKTTTLASLLNLINLTQPKHIITLEDPIEFRYTNERSIFTQRELGLDTDSFPNGIKYALRQDPDVILIGEMRDRETISSALHAAETGHLVFSTLHTVDAVQTINRIINIYEPFERDSVRRQLANVLQATLSQRLVRKVEGKGRIAVLEIMMVTPAIRDYMIRDEVEEIYQLMKTGTYDGMCNLNTALFRASKNGFISAEEALRVSDNQIELQMMLRGAYQGSA